MASINTASPTTFSSAVLIGDVGTVSGGPVDATPVFPTANSSAVSAALAIVSTKGGLLLPNMTTTQRLALNPSNGLMVFDTSLDDVFTYINGVWNATGGGSGQFGNIAISGNTISSTNTNGDINLSPNGTGAIRLNSNEVGINGVETGTGLYISGPASATIGIHLQGGSANNAGQYTVISMEDTISPTSTINTTITQLKVGSQVYLGNMGAPGTTTEIVGVDIDPVIDGNGSQTVTKAFGISVDAFVTNLVTITNAYGGYFAAPGVGTTSVALYADNLVVGGGLGNNPPANGALIGSLNFSSTTIGGVVTDADITLSPVGVGTVALWSGSHEVPLRFYNEAKNQYVELKGSNSITSNTSWTLPLIDATVARAPMVSDGAGNLSFNGLAILTTFVTLTQSQVQGMYATPVQLLPSPGAGFAIMVESVKVYTNFQTSAFASGGVAVVQYDSTVHGAGTNALASTIAAANINAAASQMFNAGQGSTTALTGISNKALYISNQTGAFTGGSGSSTVVLTVNYQIVTATV